MLRDALSTTLASLPDFHSARDELIEMLRRQAILYRSESQPVLSRDGTSARWMLDSLSVTLSPRGAQLAGAVRARTPQTIRRPANSYLWIDRSSDSSVVHSSG